MRFPLTQPTDAQRRRGFEWALGRGCLFVNGRAIDRCMDVVFDSGAGSVANIHSDSVSALVPNSDGTVTPSTLVGVSPVGDASAAVSLTAGASDGTQIDIEPVGGGNESFNTGIHAFLGSTVTYDSVDGSISVSTP